MNAFEIVRDLNLAENAIANALKIKGDSGWRWHGRKANPDIVPIIWNEIEITAPDGKTHVMPAVDYVKEA